MNNTKQDSTTNACATCHEKEREQEKCDNPNQSRGSQSYSIGIEIHTVFYLVAETIHVSSFLCCFVLFCIAYTVYGTDTDIFFVGPIQWCTQ